MAFCFNADEILKVAEGIERNGARFYREAARVAKDEATRRMFLKLADMEDSHEETFALMRRELSDAGKRPVTFDPEGQAEQYLAAMADASVFSQSADPAGLVAGRSTSDILKTALGFERDSILFYVGIQNVACQASSKARVDQVLREEMGHVALLRSHLASLG